MSALAAPSSARARRSSHVPVWVDADGNPPASFGRTSCEECGGNCAPTPGIGKHQPLGPAAGCGEQTVSSQSFPAATRSRTGTTHAATRGQNGDAKPDARPKHRCGVRKRPPPEKTGWAPSLEPWSYQASLQNELLVATQRLDLAAKLLDLDSTADCFDVGLSLVSFVLLDTFKND